MSFSKQLLSHSRPESIRDEVDLPRRRGGFPSPGDWRDEVLYFLLVDRFSDGSECQENLLDRTHLAAARPASPAGEPWRWDRWAESGGERWQGGSLAGLKSKLGYLQGLGVTAIWLSPVFRQRVHLDSYHGYGIQDFLDVDPHFGDRQALVDLVDAAHQRGIRIILDIIFNHSGPNWLYPDGEWQPPYRAYPDRYRFGHWLGAEGEQIERITGPQQGVWPQELQDPGYYTRAGSGDLGGGSIDDPFAEHKRSDFITLRDFDLQAPGVLTDLARCYKYWIALTDCDGFRIDTLKHLSLEEARNFCGTIKEFAANIGKRNFLLIGEIAGGDFNQDRYLDVLERNLDAALDIGQMRLTLNGVAKGLRRPDDFFQGFDPGRTDMGSHRHVGGRHVSILDDHDHVFGTKVRFSSEAASPHQVAAGTALQLFTLGIPCIYYGTEQSLAGPEQAERFWLPGWGQSDRYLREALFGPRHPRRSGRAGISGETGVLDRELPGFGPFGTAGRHCFDPNHGTYRRIAAMCALRAAFPALRHGRQYQRPISFLGYPFDYYGDGELIAWSRILDDEEVLCVLNPHGNAVRGADVIVDSQLNPEGTAFTVVLNSAQVADPDGFSGTSPEGSRARVGRNGDGAAYLEVRGLGPSEVLVLCNYPAAGEGGFRI
ncbi:MAG: alpha-amylase [Gammaproteobacteria bacterium]|nr:alpha-amylase [Gammaproteobacteria bacterium]